MDQVFRALADPVRRELLDRLNTRDGQTLRELCAGLEMARQSVSKHLDVLEAANLVTIVWRGREKAHHLNAEPINAIADRWISRYDRARVRALADLKTALEPTMPEFVYTTFINAPADRVWRGLTEPAFTSQYWGVELKSTWEPGASVLWGDEDLGQVVLAVDRPRSLSYTWHNYQPSHAEFFGWSAERLAELRREPVSKVTFALDERDGKTRLTVTHDDLLDSEMRRAVSGELPPSGGWPEVLAGLKTLLETGAA